MIDILKNHNNNAGRYPTNRQLERYKNIQNWSKLAQIASYMCILVQHTVHKTIRNNIFSYKNTYSIVQNSLYSLKKEKISTTTRIFSFCLCNIVPRVSRHRHSFNTIFII